MHGRKQHYGPSRFASHSSFAQQAASAPCFESLHLCTRCQAHSVTHAAREGNILGLIKELNSAHLLISFFFLLTHFTPGLSVSGISGRLESSFSSCTGHLVTDPSSRSHSCVAQWCMYTTLHALPVGGISLKMLHLDAENLTQNFRISLSVSDTVAIPGVVRPAGGGT